MSKQRIAICLVSARSTTIKTVDAASTASLNYILVSLVPTSFTVTPYCSSADFEVRATPFVTFKEDAGFLIFFGRIGVRHIKQEQRKNLGDFILTGG